MKALTRKQYGGPEFLTIQDIDKPEVKSDEILVRVHATTINRTDCGILWGEPKIIRAFTGLRTPTHLVPGTDFAGEVTVIGSGVDNFKIGDRVWGFEDEGLQSHAQYMSIKASGAVAKIPHEFSYAEAVACAEGAHYARNFINKIKFKENDRILINGATGAIGSSALQLLKSKGYYVAAVANTKNMELIKSLGADMVMDYEKEDFTKRTDKYKVICDAVGKSSFGKCKHMLEEGGIYVSSELGPRAENLYLPLFTRFSSKRVVFPFPTNCKKSILTLTDLMERGLFKPVIDKHYNMESVAEAYKYVKQGLKTGNVILDID